ncbi:MAG TPA: hypothetical protein VE174_00510, partial [Actinomycetota bacterium]|nr:hypothetical protein [Actinomycetota bacterium]
MADSAAIDARAAKALDKALSGSAVADPAIARLVEAADRLRVGFDPDVPDFRAQRAAFVQAVGGERKTWGWIRFFGPATVTAIALIVAVMLGRTALPGETFYPVRQALRAVGLAPFSMSEIDEQIAHAKQLLAQAEGLKNHDSEQARE